jgi:hypothetical protein
MFSTPFTFLKFQAGGGGLDPDAQAFLTATGITDPTIEGAINTLVVDLKAASLWTKMYAIWPMVGGTSTTTKYNLVNPQDTDAAFRMTWNGGWTFSNLGARANASNTYGNTHFVPNTDYTNNTQWSLGVYTLDTTAQVQAYVNQSLAARSQSSTELIQWYNDIGVNANFGLLDPGSEDARIFFSPAVDSQGLNWIDNESSTNHKIYKNSSLSGSGTSSGQVTPLPTVPLYLAARNNSNSSIDGHSGNLYSFAYISDSIGSANASTFYTIVEAFETALGRAAGQTTPSAQAFLTATGITGATITTAVNNLTIGLQSYGLWDKFFAIYPFVGGTSTTCKYNLVDPVDSDAAYRITFNGGYTYSSSGVLGNGSNAYGNTHVDWSAISSYTQYPMATIYMNGGNFNQGYDFGAIVSTGDFDGIISYGNNTAYVRTQTSQGYLTYNHGGTQGLYAFGQNSANGRFINLNGTNVATNTIGTFTAPDIDFYLWAINNAGAQDYSPRQYAFAGLGENFSSANLSRLYTIVQAFQTTLGRQV